MISPASDPNTSGYGSASIVPPEVKGWSWGAFLLNWIWGIGNTTWIAFLVFVPFVGMIWPFVLGAMGNEWAWKNKRWTSVEDFHRVQRKWALWGVIILCAAIVFAVLMAGLIGMAAVAGSGSRR
jgi:hypothetical protein